jgi:hypothetical protein
VANPCAICGEEMVPVYACQKPHASSGALIGSAMHACPLQKGAIWVHVIDDGGGNVKGASVTSSVGGTKDSDPSGFASFDPLDEGSAYKITLNPLSTDLAKTHRLPAIVDVPNVPVTKGQITSVQVKLERVAPLKVIIQRSDNDAFVKDIDVEVTTAVPRNAPAKATEKTPDGGTVEFPKLAGGSYKVALKLSDEDKKRWRAVDADSQDWTLDPATGATNEVTFKLTPIIQIFLKLKFKDPEDNLRDFPKNFKFNLDFEAGPEPRKREVVVNDKGIATADGKDYVEVERAAKSFKIDLKQSGVAWIVCEKRGAAKTQELVQGADPLWGTPLAKLKAEHRMFRLPVADWTLLNSRWDITQDPIKGGASLTEVDAKFGGIDALPAEVGAAAAPVELVLKPAWQFLRFTYYDRKLKGDDALSVPSKPNGESVPIIVDGWRVKGDETADKAADARSMWPLVDDDTKNVLCVPWIIGKGGDKADDKVKPDGETLLRFKRKEAKPFIHTTTAADRKLIDFTDADLRDKPSAARLDYYDLPKVWKSRGYFGWLSDADGEWGPYEDIAAKDTTLAKPLVISLDDMVLTKEDLAPVVSPWDKTKRIALFSHTFSGTDTEPGGGTGPAADPPPDKPQKPTPKGTRRWLNYQGLYNADTAAPKHLSYFSKVKMDVNYIADYPHWTRLVTMGGNLFDVFDQRTPDHAADVVGARAAVRWFNAVDGRPAGSEIPARPARVDKSFLHFQPFVSTEYADRVSGAIRYDHSAPVAADGGRFDFALLRCCDFDGGTEKAVNFVYFRMHFTFVGIAAPADAKYQSDFVGNVAQRWNGKTGSVGSSAGARVKLVPSKSPGQPIEIEHLWFGQSLPLVESQYTCEVQAGAAGRSWFDDNEGRGSLKDDGCIDSGTVNGFVGAHECGHGVGLEDDYCERWEAASYGQAGLRWHVPGDPYEPDGRIVEFQVAGAAMMNGNQQMRNRYFWHCAEWVRRATLIPLKVKLGTFDSYALPPHPNDSRNYAFWPIAAKDPFEPDATKSRGLATVLLYALGKESYTVEGLQQHVVQGASAPFDGILIVTLNLDFTMPGTLSENNRKIYLKKLAALVRDQMNGKFVATGKVNDGSADEWTFGRCLIHFSPRFVVNNHDTQSAEAADLISGMGVQFEIELERQSGSTAAAIWEPSRTVVQNIPTLATWKSGTGASAGARAPADTQLDALDTLIQEYHAINEAVVPQRVSKLRAIAQAAQSWQDQGGDLGGLFEEPVPGWNDRSGAVGVMQAGAEALADYLDAVKTERAVKFVGPGSDEIAAKFGLHFPSMIGIFKPPADVQPADLEALVKTVIPNGAVAAL